MPYVLVSDGVVTEKTFTKPNLIFNEGYAAQFFHTDAEIEIGWLYDGEAFCTPPELVAVSNKMPMAITMRQARLALLNAGLLDDVEAAIITINEPQRSQTQIEWEYAQTVERDNALVAALGPKLGLDDAAIDSLFSMAATL